MIGLHEMELATACGGRKCNRVDQNDNLVSVEPAAWVCLPCGGRKCNRVARDGGAGGGVRPKV